VSLGQPHRRVVTFSALSPACCGGDDWSAEWAMLVGQLSFGSRVRLTELMQ
jgi:hypothetical protein